MKTGGKKKSTTTKGQDKTATIEFLFKKQIERQASIREVNSESESEGDVVITDVIGLDKATVKSRPFDAKPERGRRKQMLSLAGKKRKNVENSFTDSDLTDHDDGDSKRKKPLEKQEKTSNYMMYKSQSKNALHVQSSPYRLRKRKALSLIEVSDSEVETDSKSSYLEDFDKQQDGAEADQDKKTSETKHKPKAKGKPVSAVSGLVLDKHEGLGTKSCLKDLKRTETSSLPKGKLSLKKIIHVEAVSKENFSKAKIKTFESDRSSDEHVEVKVKNSIAIDSSEFNILDDVDETKAEQVLFSSNEDRDKHPVVSKRAELNVSENKKKEENTPSLLVGDSMDCDIDNDVDLDNNKGVKGTQTTENLELKVPYYLENFKTIISNVMDDAETSGLFDETDRCFISSFNESPEPCQKLYVRLFGRKLAWLPMSKLNYPEIGDNIPHLVDTLTGNGLLSAGEDLHDLHTVLKIMSAADLKALAKSFHINSGGLTKPKIIEQVLKKGQQNAISTMFTGGGSGNMEKTIIKRAKGYLGKVCRLQEDPRAVFIRMLMLFSLYNTNFDEDNGNGGQNQLFQMLMVNIGKVVYPTYTVIRERTIFKDRAALVRFQTAVQFELDIQAKTEHGKWQEAYTIYQCAKEVGMPVLNSDTYQSWDRDLPQFLRLYTAGSVYTRIDNLGVEILQRLKQYKEAVELLQTLLVQSTYCEHYRGHWYERMALNLEAHLKSTEKSLDVILSGLSDPTVRQGRRYALYERGRKICEAPKSKFVDRLSELEHDVVRATPEVTVEGTVLSDATAAGMKYQFVMQGDTNSVTLCAVEEYVLEHYKSHGFPEGLHAEGSIVSNLFVLFFWEILFMEVADVFRGPFQTCPLDIATQDFYQNRKQHIDERLHWLRNSSLEELSAEVGSIWENHAGTMCFGINWETFTGPDTHQRLVSCMGGQVIAGILERYVKDPRHTRSGFPDLTLWNADTKQLKICEVKGPNDKLSYKQILWIDHLVKLGVDAEVCYVKAVGAKKLKPPEKS